MSQRPRPVEELSAGPTVHLGERRLRHQLEAGELGVLGRVGVHRRAVGCSQGGMRCSYGEVGCSHSGVHFARSRVKSDMIGYSKIGGVGQ